MANFGTLDPKSWYNTYLPDRSSHETMAKQIAGLSLPYVFMPDGATASTKMPDSLSQAFNGRLINTLKGKMGMSLLPPSTSSFRLEPDAEALSELVGADADKKAIIYEQISSVTSRINKELEAQQIRDTVFEMLAQLIVVGCVIMEKRDGSKGAKKGIRLHTLRNFTVDLDADGEPRGMCISETLKDLPEGIVVAKGKEKAEYELYTLIERDPVIGDWRVTQSIDSEIVGEEISYTDETLPFQYVGWTWTDGDSYHRPYAEDYYPDMREYNTLSSLITKGSIIASKVILFVNEQGNRTRKADVAKSANGAVVNGVASDVTALQLQKNFDFQVPMERLADIGKNLSAAFLMNESITRNAERVTAEEIRYMAQELETSSLSGVYSKLSKKVSLRIITWIMGDLNIKFNAIDVNIVTGLDALGRSQEAQKLDAVVQRLASMNMLHWLKEEELVVRYTSYEGVDSSGLLRTPKEVQEMLTRQQQQQTQQTGANALVENAAKAVTQQV